MTTTTSAYIAKASTARLLALLDTQLDQDQADEILAELDARDHDLSDPSSGLGCWNPS